MANLIGNSLFTGAISGLQSNYLLLLNGSKSLTLDNILHPQSDAVKYSVNQSFRGYLMTNFNNIDMDGDGKISANDMTNYTSKLKTQGMTYNELTQLCANGSGSISSLLDTVLSNFNEIDTNHDGRITQGEINAYRISQEKKDIKDEFPQIDPTNMSMFYETKTENTKTASSDTNNKVFK